MKALVMTAQDAREFEKLGGLTITKGYSDPTAYAAMTNIRACLKNMTDCAKSTK